mmetsp:Transcript_91925/g.286557  ORF Transcript_91925/g.286557 Transcript_91925/m.286557 type:complete len:210 (-) Transcript_91925:13-642(-)
MKYPSSRKRRSNSSGSSSPMARSSRERAAPLACTEVGEPAVKAEEMDSCFVSSALTRESMACRSSTTRACAARTSSDGGSTPVGSSSSTLPHSHSSPLGRGILPSASMPKVPSKSRRTIVNAPSPYCGASMTCLAATTSPRLYQFMSEDPSKLPHQPPCSLTTRHQPQGAGASQSGASVARWPWGRRPSGSEETRSLASEASLWASCVG